MNLGQATSLSIVVLMLATAAQADVRGAPNPPSFTREELEIVKQDQRLVYAARNCPWELRRAFDVLDDIRRGSRPSVLPGPCRSSSDEMGRASDEGALDILKILKEAAGQGTSRSGIQHGSR